MPEGRTTRLHKKLRSMMEKVIREYGMIEDGDRVLVGVSGGPDSLTLLNLMLGRQAYAEEKYELIVGHIDLGFRQEEPTNRRRLDSHFESLGIDYHVVPTNISDHALAPDARKNPCFICSVHRRRKIYELAHRNGCNKIAYGHHKDDIVETLLINILFGRKIEAMHPVQEVFKGKMHIIRPLAYAEEELLKKFAREQDLPDLPRLCPADGATRRQKVKEIIATLQGEEPKSNIRENIFKSLSHVNIDPAK